VPEETGDEPPAIVAEDRVPGAEPAGIRPWPAPPGMQYATGPVAVWTERESSGGWYDCTYCSALMVLVAAGKVDYPLGIYTRAECNALEEHDTRPDDTGATFADTDLAVLNRYGVAMHYEGRISSATLRTRLGTAGRAYCLAGLNANLPNGVTNWDTGFAGAHAVCVIPQGSGSVLWLDPLAPDRFAGESVAVEEVVSWAASLNGDSHDPRYMALGELALEDDPLQWMDDATPYLARVYLTAGQQIRSGPVMSSGNVSITLEAPYTATVVCKVISGPEGEYHGSREWLVYPRNDGGWYTFHEKQAANIELVTFATGKA
jgi:hypothetical protein